MNCSFVCVASRTHVDVTFCVLLNAEITCLIHIIFTAHLDFAAAWCLLHPTQRELGPFTTNTVCSIDQAASLVAEYLQQHHSKQTLFCGENKNKKSLDLHVVNLRNGEMYETQPKYSGQSVK